MSGWTSRSQKLLYDLLPILFALLVAVVYFLMVVPNTRPSQTQSAGRNTGAVKAREARMVQVSGSMDHVASSPQEVSSAILEMQASVEEIARNAGGRRLP